jgi:hypothetical protein
MRPSRIISWSRVTVLAALGLLVFAAPASAALLNTADEGTVQVDGEVRTILDVGNRIYIGGTFTRVDGVTRNNLAAINATTGELDPTWNPNANGGVQALASAAGGTRIYVGGNFTTMGRQSRNRLAAVDTTTGAVDPAWTAACNDRVRALVVSGNRVYIGGDFTSVKGQGRTRLALLDGTTGDPYPNWTPSANGIVRALDLSAGGGRLYAGGEFTSISGVSRPYLASVDAVAGNVDSAFVPPSPNGIIWDIASPGARVYTAEGGNGGGVAAAYDAATGARAWARRGDGDVQGVTALDGLVYVAGHFENFSGQSRRVFAAMDERTGTLDSQWTPTADPTFPGVWVLEPDAARTRLYTGGGFTSISGQAHRRFAQFSKNPISVDTRVLAATADTQIMEGSPNTNYGGATSLGMDGDTASGRDKSALLRWNLSGIGPGTKVSSASVTLAVSNPSLDTYEAYALRRAWVESEVNWNSYAAGGPWELAGARGSLDRDATAVGSVTPSSTGEQTFDLPASLVQRWVDDPSSNSGLVLADTINTDGADFYSREVSDSSLHPRLTVNLEGADATPPETNIDSGPSGTVGSSTADFAFSSSEAGSSFECSLDSAPFAPCSSPRQYSGLSDGQHAFEVRATDAAGNTDTTPAGRAWAVDTTPPADPSGLVATASSSQIDLSWSDNASNESAYAVERSLDGLGGWTEIAPTLPANSTSYTDTGLSPNTAYHYRVRATNASGASGYSAVASATTPDAPAYLFSDGWDLADGVAWDNAKWAADGGTSAALDVRSGEGRMRFENVSGAMARAIARMPRAQNAEVLASFRFPSGDPKGYLQILLRSSDTWTGGFPTSAYYVEVANDSSNVSLRRASSGTVTQLRSGSVGQLTTQKQWVRLRVEGQSIRAKVWTEGTAEPAGWELETPDASFSGAGVLALRWARSSTATGAREAYLDDLTVRNLDT